MRISIIDHAIAQRKRIGQHPSNAQLRRAVEGLTRLNILLAKSQGYPKQEAYDEIKRKRAA